MNELIKPEIDEHGEQVIDARNLHDFLEVGKDFSNWFKDMSAYGFVEGEDFTPISAKSSGGRPRIEYAIKLDMAKELAMIQRTAKGKQAREYFVEVEKQFNSPEMMMARSLQFANQKLERYENQIEIMRPKALFADSVATSDTTILIGQLAKLIKQNGISVGQNRLFQWMRENGYLISRKSDRNMPTQRSMELGLFKVIERTTNNPDGSVRITKTTKVTGKGQQYFINKFLKIGNDYTTTV
ncbi:phage antirepressor KilAC domain-containing protein [Pediococcus inopinatus]|uniref:phage antirepressor KilAC domain-containing protein n=1 Tax=Pediococcus inopinatus TaxID=114090 RepID=UPI002B263F7F|nr:phage antirepressor KilAC domain-containing protein [Pediococcus inopinatus]WPC19490.1 phage antirepressor KilAC domain-containing protein [Pediococcus inopinatus]